MNVVRVSDTIDTEREVHCPKGGFASYRLLLERDGMGFSVHYTVVPRGEPQKWHYKNHLEACYCIEGRGWLTDCATGETHLIESGTLYALDNHDEHIFRAETASVVLLSIFNPAVTGREVHDKDGSYERSEA